MNLNINYKNIFLAIIAAILLSIPTAAALNSRNNALQIERTKGEQLQFNLEKRENELDKVKIQTKEQIEQERQKREEVEKENERLKRELQAKAERKAEEARIAAANAEKQRQAAVSVSRSNVGTSGNCESYRSLVARHFPANQIDNALLTMQRESGCRPNAVSPTNDHGLMQINCKYHCHKVGGNVNALYDPETNVRLAAEIFNGRGWNAWYAVRGILW